MKIFILSTDFTQFLLSEHILFCSGSFVTVFLSVLIYLIL
jgi:hypothetical protein